jgi:hypothetical protein
MDHKRMGQMTEEEFLKAKLKEAYELLAIALPFIVTHYENSHGSTGMGAKNLMNKIKEVLGVR